MSERIDKELTNGDMSNRVDAQPPEAIVAVFTPLNDERPHIPAVLRVYVKQQDGSWKQVDSDRFVVLLNGNTVFRDNNAQSVKDEAARRNQMDATLNNQGPDLSPDGDAPTPTSTPTSTRLRS